MRYIMMISCTLMEVSQCLDDVPSWFSEIDLNLGEGLSRLLRHRTTASSVVFIPTQFKLIHQSNFILTVLGLTRMCWVFVSGFFGFTQSPINSALTQKQIRFIAILWRGTCLFIPRMSKNVLVGEI